MPVKGHRWAARRRQPAEAETNTGSEAAEAEPRGGDENETTKLGGTVLASAIRDARHGATGIVLAVLADAQEELLHPEPLLLHGLPLPLPAAPTALCCTSKARRAPNALDPAELRKASRPGPVSEL